MLSLPSSYGHVLNHTRIYIETVILCLCLETLLPSFYHLLPSNLTTATKLSPNQTLSFLFKLLLLNINMCHFAYDDLCPQWLEFTRFLEWSEVNQIQATADVSEVKWRKLMSDDILSEVKWNEMQVTKAQVKWSEVKLERQVANHWHWSGIYHHCLIKERALEFLSIEPATSKWAIQFLPYH